MRLVWSTKSEFANQRSWRGNTLTPEELSARAENEERRLARSKYGYCSNWWKHLNPLIGPRMRLPQLKDISDLQVLRAIVKAKCMGLKKYPYELLMEELGVPEKLAYRAMERCNDRKLVDYGISLRTCWLEDKGRAMLSAEELAEYDAAQEAWMRPSGGV